MIRRASALFMLGLLVSLLFRWEIGQAGMWARMIERANERLSLADAITVTLSGTAPCPECLRMTESKAKSMNTENFVSSAPPESPLAIAEGCLAPHCPCIISAHHFTSDRPWNEAPIPQAPFRPPIPNS